MTFLTYMVNIFALTGVILASPMAYIDPNTGGMLFQLLAVFLAIFSGVIFFFSRQIKSLFAKLRRKIRNETEPVEPELIVDVKEENSDPGKEG
jgi:hypothetical protein